MTISTEEDFLIGPNDTLVVLREDGTYEISFPEVFEDSDLPANVITGAAVMYALEDEELNELIHENFAIQCEEFAYMDATNDNAAKA